MTLLYRAIWNDNRPELIDKTTEQFQSWILSKRLGVELPHEGHASGVSKDGVFGLTVRRGAAGSCTAIQIELDEDRSTGERWTTRMVVIDDQDGPNWVWIDLDRVAANTADRPDLIAPRLARELIEAGSDARVDHVRLTTSSHPISPSGLAGLIRNENRTLPIVVFSESAIEGPTPAIKRADAVARRLAGSVQVMRLANHTVEEFKELVGDDLGVWGGAARIYLPNLGPGGLRPDRHRSISLAQMGRGETRVGSIIANILTSSITARRPPRVYEDLQRELQLGHTDSDSSAMLALAWVELDRLTAQNAELSADLERANEDLLDTQADLDSEVTSRERLASALRVIRLGDSAGNPEAQMDLDVEVSSMEEAIAFARQRLDCLVIPVDATERDDIELLDGTPTGATWGNMTWRGLRALHLYASADFNGDFRLWCMDSGDEWSWTPSDKHLAMHESESVARNARLRNQRLFTIPTEIDPSGRVYMEAHLKIAQGGGDLAPRVYFYDDTRGPTGKVHIGFIGPHRHVENTRTN